MPARVTQRLSSLIVLALILIAAGAVTLTRPARDEVLDGCAEPGCVEPEAVSPTEGAAATLVLRSDDFCRNVGYLCAELETSGELRLRRWTAVDGTLVVHVPLPDLADGTRARELQRAAAQGIRSWNDQPFPILTELRGERTAHFSVVWTESLGGTRIGLARTQWSQGGGLTVEAIELATHDPYGRGPTASNNQIRLTAAHEMGHALGLGHSDSERDVMYPTNAARYVSARDRRSMEVLYDTPDGTIIRR